MKNITRMLLLMLLVGCTAPKAYYPIVADRTGDQITVELHRKNDVITFIFADSLLNKGDTVKFSKGSTPIEVKIIDTHGDYQSYIIRP